MSYTFEEFEKNLGYEFKDKELLKLAFTHTTYVFEHHQKHYESNQRLEFVGDAVLDLVIGQKLYELKPHADEGYLSKTRSLVVCERSLASVARKLRVGELLMLGKGEAQSGGADKDSTLSDVVESFIAAVYFDAGFAEAERVILKNLSDIIDDFKNSIQCVLTLLGGIQQLANSILTFVGCFLNLTVLIGKLDRTICRLLYNIIDCGC